MTDDEFEALRKTANEKSDAAYARDVSSTIRLTQTEIESIIRETAVDKAILAKLIAEVNSAAKSNRAKADAIRNTTGFAEMAVAIISKLL